MLDKFHDSPLFNREFKGLNKLGRQRKIAIMKDGSLREFKKPTLKMDKVFQVQEYEMEYQLILKPKKERQEIEHGKE